MHRRICKRSVRVARWELLHGVMPDRFEAAAHRISVLRGKLPWTSPLRILSMLCDVILDDTVETIATNGSDLLVNPSFAAEASEKHLTDHLEAAVRAAVALLPELAFALPGSNGAAPPRRGPPGPGVLLPDASLPARLRPPPPGLDLAACWGRRCCWTRHFLMPFLAPGYQDPLLPEGPCLACLAGEHRPFVPPHFGLILRGSPRAPARVPPFAEECFCLVWAFTSPMLSPREQLAALQWLTRCGASEWALLAFDRLAASSPAWLDGTLWCQDPERLAIWRHILAVLPRQPEPSDG